jgi:hypothetical protein
MLGIDRRNAGTRAVESGADAGVVGGQLMIWDSRGGTGTRCTAG